MKSKTKELSVDKDELRFCIIFLSLFIIAVAYLLLTSITAEAHPEVEDGELPEDYSEPIMSDTSQDLLCITLLDDAGEFVASYIGYDVRITETGIIFTNYSDGVEIIWNHKGNVSTYINR